MNQLEQLKQALAHTIKITKDPRFTSLYNAEEQDFFKSHVRELNEEINAEYEAIEFIRQREMRCEHEAV